MQVTRAASQVVSRKEPACFNTGDAGEARDLTGFQSTVGRFLEEDLAATPLFLRVENSVGRGLLHTLVV